MVAVASARGIDWLQTASMSQKPAKGAKVKTKRFGTFTAVTLMPPARYRAAGTADRPAVKPRWTVAELGQAAKNVPPVCFQAACYSFAGDDSHYWALHRALVARGRLLMTADPRYPWPQDITDVHGLRKPYLDLMCITVLDADRHAARFNAMPGLYAAWMHVTDRTWEHDLEYRFWMLHAVWREWKDQAARMIQSKLRAE